MLKSNSERVRKLKHLKIMDNKKRAKILMEVLTNDCKTFSDKKQFINNSLTEICSGEKLPVDQVFFALVLSLMTVFVTGIMV